MAPPSPSAEGGTLDEPTSGPDRVSEPPDGSGLALGDSGDTGDSDDVDVESAAVADRAADDPYAGLLRELRGPVASIQSYVRTLIARDADLSASARATVHQVILQQSRRLDAFVDDVVLYVRLVTAGVDLHPEPVLVSSLVEQVRHRLDEPDRVALGDGLDVVVAVDRAALEAMLRRLVRNGLVYGPRHGTVRVDGVRGAGVLSVRVADDGPGLDPAQAAAAVQAFRRAVRPGERRSDGVGLGLAVTRELAVRVGGDLTLSTGGPGLTASLTLPLPR